MSEAKHTKGDWYAVPPNPYAREEDGERATYLWSVHTRYPATASSRAVGHQVCEITSMNTGAEEATASLIASAPELLEALQKLAAAYERLKSPGYPQADVEKQAGAAIAKATGVKA